MVKKAWAWAAVVGGVAVHFGDAARAGDPRPAGPVTVAASAGSPTGSSSASSPDSAGHQAIRDRVDRAIDAGLSFLLNRQRDDGSWAGGSADRDLLVTAVALRALVAGAGTSAAPPPADSADAGKSRAALAVSVLATADDAGQPGGPCRRYYHLAWAARLAGEGGPWRERMARKIAELQRPDGGWAGAGAVTGEDTLASAYAVLALCELRAGR